MPTLDQIEAEVNGLDLNANENPSSPFDYFDAYDHLIEALQSSGNGDKPKLRAILATFRDKLLETELVQFDSMRIKARKLDEALTVSSVGALIEAINARNVALPDLLKTLKDEIKKGNDDANRLKEIKEAIEKATKTVDELKTLVDALTDTDASVISSLEALIKAAGNISSTFMPDES